jgi:hypothetical protein
MSEKAPVVEATNVKKTYMLGKIPVDALRGVNFRVESGILSRSLDPQAAVNPQC